MAFGIAVVGTDHWYTAFGVLDICAASTETPLVAAWERFPERLTVLKEKYPNALVTDNVDEILIRDDISLVAICVPTADAPELAKRALKAGKHVVSVKPPAKTLAELDEVIAVADASGKFYASFEGMQRLHPRQELLRDLIAGGAIGTPLSYHQIGHGGLPSPYPGQTGPSWWIDGEKVPGGAWIDHAIYAVDLARFVFGGEVVDASGFIEKRIHPDLTVEDYGISLMRLARPEGSRVSLMFEDTWAALPGGGFSQVRFIGTQGTIHPDGNAWVVTRGGETVRHEVVASHFFPFDKLAAHLTAGTALPFSSADARANLVACLRVYESAK